ncbi:9586_t:CDS:2 [Paraglomus occultum]|uniref:DNA replication complex GINS protein PSF2 n=1 Tax=Paraglomus occultum TaxID=144539 RepID=A0A9N9F182_9GLOM|nr:9586_t:CDS:2 [Paraglomus occultum]
MVLANDIPEPVHIKLDNQVPTLQEYSYALSELEFLATQSLVRFEPTSALPVVKLICGTYGPFSPPRKTYVPLWLALCLYEHDRGRILLPEWMTAEALAKSVEEEQKFEGVFSSIHPHWMVISKILIEKTGQDIPNLEEIKKSLQRLKEIRWEKMRRGVSELNPYHLQTNNLSYMEINLIRPVFVKAMQTLRKINPAESTAL